MKTAVIYARFSCSKQREASIDDQVRVCREYCDREGIEVKRIYTDYAISGRTDERPEFQEMISNAGECDYVIVFQMDRFSRDPYDAPIYKKRLLKKGVRVLSALERVDDTPDGIIMEKLLEGLAARESMVTAERTRRGMRGNALKCRYNGDRIYGYRVVDGKYEINEDEAPIVREAFRMRMEREPVAAIAKRLAALGVRTYQGNPCSPTMAANMLKNERYAGVYKWGDVRVEGGMPAIIDRGTFDAVQGIKGRKRRETERWAKYALSGRAICGECGRNMVGVSARNRLGVRYEYYRCGAKCGAPTVRRDELEGMIAAAIRSMLDGDEAVRIAHKAREAWNASEAAQMANASLEAARTAHRRHDNIMRAVEDGLPLASVRGRLEELEREERDARREYDAHVVADFDEDDFVAFLRIGATLDDAALLDAFVAQAVVFDDRVAVALNYGEDENTPGRIELERVRRNQEWLPVAELVLTQTGRAVLWVPI